MTFITDEIPMITTYVTQQNPLLSPKPAHMEINSPRTDQQQTLTDFFLISDAMF